MHIISKATKNYGGSELAHNIISRHLVVPDNALFVVLLASSHYVPPMSYDCPIWRLIRALAIIITGPTVCALSFSCIRCRCHPRLLLCPPSFHITV